MGFSFLVNKYWDFFRFQPVKITSWCLEQTKIIASNFHMVLKFKDHHNAYPWRAQLNCNSQSPDFVATGCSEAHFRWDMSWWDHTLKTESNDLSGNFAVKGQEENLGRQNCLSGLFHPSGSQAQQLCSQKRRGCIEHLQKGCYVFAVGLDAAEMLQDPLGSAQSHSAYRRESIKDLGHMDTAEAVAGTTLKRQQFCLQMRSQGQDGFNGNRQQL